MNGFVKTVNQTAIDQQELTEWRDALDSLVRHADPERAREILDMLADAGNTPAIGWKPRHGTPYINSIAVD